MTSGLFAQRKFRADYGAHAEQTKRKWDTKEVVRSGDRNFEDMVVKEVSQDQYRIDDIRQEIVGEFGLIEADKDKLVETGSTEALTGGDIRPLTGGKFEIYSEEHLTITCGSKGHQNCASEAMGWAIRECGSARFQVKKTGRSGRCKMVKHVGEIFTLNNTSPSGGEVGSGSFVAEDDPDLINKEVK